MGRFDGRDDRFDGGTRACRKRAAKTHDITFQWRKTERSREVRSFAARLAGQRWTLALIQALLEELYVDDSIVDLFGELRLIPVARYPQLIAVALALRHSWRPDDFNRFTHRFAPLSRVRAIRSHRAVAHPKHHK